MFFLKHGNLLCNTIHDAKCKTNTTGGCSCPEEVLAEKVTLTSLTRDIQ